MFGKKKDTPPPPSEPIRRDKVIDAIKKDMDFGKAMDKELEGPAFDRIKKAHDDALRGLTKAEIARVYEAQNRHGY